MKANHRISMSGEEGKAVTNFGKDARRFTDIDRGRR
jgi:hypothetical protein